MKYGELNLGQIEAVINKLGGMDGVNRFLRGELSVSEPTRSWREEDGVIYFSVTSDGTTGEEWITYLEGKGFRVSDYAKSILRSPDFKPTPAGTMYHIAVLKGELFSDDNRITKNIRAEAKKRKFITPHPEVACLIRDQFSDEDIKAMGLWYITAMHEPIVSAGDPFLLDVARGAGGRWLGADYGMPDDRWYRANGFAFAVPQASASDTPS